MGTRRDNLPLVQLESCSSHEAFGDVIGDLHRRRGSVHGQSMRGHLAVVDARVPLAAMFGYVGSLRALTKGRAHFSMQFDRCAPKAEARTAEAVST